jgi:1-acyl-sn-glycerol-3-phosphate acyltransferase
LIFALAVLLAVFVPVSRWDAFVRSSLWEHFLRYFRVQVIGVPPPQPGGRGGIVYSVAPHGIVPFSLGLLQYGSLGAFMGFPRITTASIVRYIPFFSHMLYLGGAVEATKTEMGKVLQSGGSIGVTPGGISEMFLGYPQPGCASDEEFALLHNRKGFVRLALQYGSTLVPVFCFGASSTFSRIVMPPWVEALSRSLRASIMLFYGKWGLPIPWESPLTYALGEHIPCGAGHARPLSAPSAEEVDWVHNVFIRSLEKTFELNKALAGQAGKTLRVV